MNNQEVESIKQIVFDAYEAVLNNRAFEVQDKGKQDIVTDLDFAMERHIKGALQALFPEDRFIGEEENHETLEVGRTWVCDPIDGTLNFTQNIPYYGVQLALLVQKELIFSLIYLPQLNEMYHAVKGQGAYIGDMKLKMDSALPLSRAIVTSGKNGCHILFSKNIWELAPGTMLATEAGCEVYRLSGVRHGFPGEGLIVAGNTAILNEVVAILEAL